MVRTVPVAHSAENGKLLQDNGLQRLDQTF